MTPEQGVVFWMVAAFLLLMFVLLVLMSNRRS